MHGFPARAADFSVFVGDLAPDVTDYALQEHFRQFFASVRSAKVSCCCSSLQSLRSLSSLAVAHLAPRLLQCRISCILVYCPACIVITSVDAVHLVVITAGHH